MKKLIFSILIMLVVPNINARVIEEDKRALIDSMLELSGGKQVVGYMAQVLTVQLVTVLQKKYGTLDQAVADIIMQEAQTIMYEEYVLSNRLNEIYYDIYDENFSTEELTEMVDFFSTPTGKRTLTTLPLISKRSQEMAQAHAKKIGPKAQDRIMKQLANVSSILEKPAQ